VSSWRHKPVRGSSSEVVCSHIVESQAEEARFVMTQVLFQFELKSTINSIFA
jgi:hypothetical protein